MRKSLILLAVLLAPAIVNAQTTLITTGAVEFQSADHNTILTDGTPALTGYQGLLIGAATDPVTGTTLQVGMLVPKTTAAVVNTITWRLTIPQLGVTVPACTTAQANCPAYRVVLLSIGPNGTSPRVVGATSGPFAATTTAAPPASPTNVRVVPQ